MTTPNPPQTCPECGISFRPLDVRRIFCSPEHKTVWNNRNNGIGAPLVTLLKAWRMGRNKKGNAVSKYAFSELCTMIDAANAEDRIAGRTPAIEILKNRYRREGLNPDGW